MPALPPSLPGRREEVPSPNCGAATRSSPRPGTHTRSSAFSLVELALALGIAGFALLVIFGLIPIGLNGVSTSTRQTTATDIISTVAADMRQCPSSANIATHTSLAAVSPIYGIPLSSGSTSFYTDDCGTKLASSGSATFQVNVTVASAPTPPARTATMATVQISWPALAAPAHAAGSLTGLVALDIN